MVTENMLEKIYTWIAILKRNHRILVIYRKFSPSIRQSIKKCFVLHCKLCNSTVINTTLDTNHENHWIHNFIRFVFLSQLRLKIVRSSHYVSSYALKFACLVLLCGYSGFSWFFFAKAERLWFFFAYLVWSALNAFTFFLKIPTGEQKPIIYSFSCEKKHEIRIVKPNQLVYQ